MERKIVGILICMMLVTTFFTTTTIGTNFVSNKSKDNALGTSSFEDDVPIWEKENKWIYIIDDIDIGDITSGHLHLQIGELSLTVIDDTGSSYDLELKANIEGYFEIVDDEQEINIRVEFQNSKIEGTISFRKTDLGIEKVNVKLSGKLKLNINIPDLPFSIPKIPFGFTIDINLDFDGPFSLFDFPLYTNKIWGLPATNCTVTGEMRSLWFNLINLMNKLVPFLPPEIAKLFPVINIEEALVEFLETNIFPIPEMPGLFNCSNIEMRTVPAGSYEAYHIIVGESGSIYFAPDVGKIIEISQGTFNMVLKKYSTDIKPRVV